MGLPQSVHDDDIHPQLPHFDGSAQRVAALHMQIRLCRSIASVGRGVYGVNGRLNKKFLLSTKKVLENIAGLADELQQQFPLGVDKAINGVSRVAGYLHTLYHQVISHDPIQQWPYLLTSSVHRSSDTTLATLLPQNSLRNTRRYHRSS
jgi:hypothetical protein